MSKPIDIEALHDIAWAPVKIGAARETVPQGGDRPKCKVPGCARSHRGHGYCNMHYQRWVKTGSVGSASRSRRTPPNLDDGRPIQDHLLELFLSGIHKRKDGCWVCKTAYPMNTDYTEVKIGRGAMGIFRQTTHTLSYEHFKGKIPEGKLVCHTCDNRACCNPDHLFLGTHLDNQGDMARKNRVAHGERHYNAKLSESDVLTIRSLAKSLTAEELAERFGVSAKNIGHVIRGDTWKRLYSRRTPRKRV